MTTQITYSQWEQLGQNILGIPSYTGFSNATINDNGNVIAVGVENTNFIDVYYLVNNQWEFKGNSIEISGTFASVSLSGDGDTIAIGQPAIGGGTGGGFEVYNFDGTDWEQKGSSIIGETSEFLGSVIKLNKFGDKVIVGGPNADCNDDIDCGVVRVFQFDGSDWFSYGQTIFGDDHGFRFGEKVAINNEGNIIAFSTNNYIDVPNSNSVGLVRIYNFNGTEWEQLGQDIISDTPGQPIGSSVSLSGSGNIVAFGGALYNENSINDGIVEVYEYNSNEWDIIGNRIVGENENDSFGSSVGLNNEGNILTIGASLLSNMQEGAGYVQNYRIENNNWNQIGNNIYGDVDYEHFGSNVAINAAGNRIVSISRNINSLIGLLKVYGNDSVLNIFEHEDLYNFKIYPNPSNNLTQIELGELFEAFSITVSDVSGKILLEKNYFNVSEISLNTNLKPGVYFIKLNNGTYVSTQKLIIK